MSALIAASTVTLGLNKNDASLMRWARSTGLVTEQQTRDVPTPGFKLVAGPVHGHARADLVRTMALLELLKHVSYEKVTTLFDCYPSHRILRLLLEDLKNVQYAGPPQRLLDYCAVTGFEPYDTPRDASRLPKVTTAAANLRMYNGDLRQAGSPKHNLYNVLSAPNSGFSRFPSGTPLFSKYRCLEFDAILNAFLPLGHYGFLLMDIYWIDEGVILNYLDKIAEYDSANAAAGTPSYGHLYWIGHPISGEAGLLADDVAWWSEMDSRGAFVTVPPQAGLPETYKHPRPSWLTSPNISVCCLRTVPRSRLGAMYVVELLRPKLNAEPFRLPDPLVDYMLIPAGWEVWAMQKFGTAARSFGAWLDRRAAERGDAIRKLCFPRVVQALHEKYAARSVTSITHTSLQRAAVEEINLIDSISVLRTANPARFAEAVEGTAMITMAGEASQRTALDLWSLPAACFARFVIHRRLKRALGEAVPVESSSYWDLLWQFRYPLVIALAFASYLLGFRLISGCTLSASGSLMKYIGRAMLVAQLSGATRILPAAYDVAAVVIGSPLLEETAKLWYPMRHYIALFETFHRTMYALHIYEQRETWVKILVETAKITTGQAWTAFWMHQVTLGLIVLSRPVHYLSTGSFVRDVGLHAAWNGFSMLLAGQLPLPQSRADLVEGASWVISNLPAIFRRYLHLHVENWKYALWRVCDLYAVYRPVVESAAHAAVNAPMVPSERPRIPVSATDLWDVDENLFAPALNEVSVTASVSPDSEASGPIQVQRPEHLRGLTAAEILARMSRTSENTGPDHTVFNPADWVEDDEVQVEAPVQQVAATAAQGANAAGGILDLLTFDPSSIRDFSPISNPGDPDSYPPLWAHLGACHAIADVLSRHVPGLFLSLQTNDFDRPLSLGMVVALSNRLPDFGPFGVTHFEAQAFVANQTGVWKDRLSMCRAPEGVYPGLLYRKKEGLPNFEVPQRRDPSEMVVRTRGLPRDLEDIEVTADYMMFRSKTHSKVTSLIDPGVWWCRPATTVANTIGMALARLLAQTPGDPADIQRAIAIDQQILFDGVYVPNGSPVFRDGTMWAVCDVPSIPLARRRNLVELYSAHDRLTFFQTDLQCPIIEVTTDMEDAWLRNFSGHKLARNSAALARIRDNHFDLDDPSVRVVTAMVKSDETLARRQSNEPGLKPRMIATLQPEIQAFLGPAFLVVAQRLACIWTWDMSLAPRMCILQDYAKRSTGYGVNYHMTYAYQPTARKLTEWMRSVVESYRSRTEIDFFLRVIVAGDDHLVMYAFPKGPLCWLEGDVSMCDQSQTYPTLMRDVSRYCALGLPYPMAMLVLELAHSAIILDLTKSRGEYSIEVIPKMGTKLSGGPDTSCGTSICVGEMVISAMFYEFIDWAVCNPLGARLHRNPSPSDIEPGYSRSCLDRGMQVKVKAGLYTETCIATFLKGWWVPTSEGPIWTPLPSRIFKVGIADGDVIQKYVSATGEHATEPVVALANHLANVAAGLSSTFLTPPLSYFARAWVGCLKSRINVKDWMVEYDYRTDATLDVELFSQQLERRYDVEYRDLEEIGLRYSVPIIPLLVVHPAIDAMVKVDYS